MSSANALHGPGAYLLKGCRALLKGEPIVFS